MPDEKYNRSINLTCPTCGGTYFEHGADIENNTASITCVGCDQTFSKNDLTEQNNENIQRHANELKQEAIKDIAQQIQRSLKKR